MNEMYDLLACGSSVYMLENLIDYMFKRTLFTRRLIQSCQRNSVGIEGGNWV